MYIPKSFKDRLTCPFNDAKNVYLSAHQALFFGAQHHQQEQLELGERRKPVELCLYGAIKARSFSGLEQYQSLKNTFQQKHPYFSELLGVPEIGALFFKHSCIRYPLA